MEDPDTDTLRKLAPCWTLAGDESLLTILQNTHQRLVSKCQEVNTHLEQMATALDDANISLQNVNNQFMALSSSQFIERRVYQDDADVTVDVSPAKDIAKPSPPDELSILKRSIEVIEGTHEVITILHDSDTESDTDDEASDRLVMKPKDLYADRPLPYIIGSEPWKNKWHAGLMPEDSDTDSSSKIDRDSDQYSQSEPEDFDSVHPSQGQETSSINQHIRTLSETSSELPSEATPNMKPTPSDVASEIARRLGAGLPTKPVEVESEDDVPAKPAVRKIYKPQEPVTSTIFPDEPPPLEESGSEDGDIFEELHREPYNQPYAHHYVSDMFAHHDGDIFSDFVNQPTTKPTSIFDAGPTPHMFDKQISIASTEIQTNTEQARTDIPKYIEDNEEKVKKPVGGISLFGSNRGAESIGTAILKRNQRKSSTSGDESGNDVAEQPPPPIKEQIKKEKDIFDDLFAKNESKIKPKVNNIVQNKHIQRKSEEIKKDIPKTVDLFSDNLFDDIDDIFTTNIIKTSTDNKKSLFEEDDDLFSEIAEPKPVKQDVKSNNDKKSIFDGDDDLFSENIKVKPSISGKSDSVTKISENPTKTEITKTISIFDDDEHNIFNNTKVNVQVQNITISTENTNLTKNIESAKNIFKSPSLFDDDDNENDLFAETVTSTITRTKETNNKVTIETSQKTEVVITKENPENVNFTDKMINVISNTIKDIENIDTTTSINNETISDPTNFKEDTKTKEKPIFEHANSREHTKTKEKPISEHTKSVEDTKTKENNVIDDGTVIKQITTKSDIPEPIKENIESSTAKSPIDKMLKDSQKTSDDDFSEQDFDDEPIQTAKSNQNNVSNLADNKSNLTNIFDNLGLEEDIFASPQPTIVEKETTISNKTDAKVDNYQEIPKSDVFTDIISEPPVFEKPKEPKRSKNVNALFDDDSDDEALFFKKEDVCDEKPEDFTVKQDTLFGLFTDEPPDDMDSNIFNTLPTPKAPDDKPKKDAEINFNDDVSDKPIANDSNNENKEAKLLEIPIPEPKANFKISSKEIDTSLSLRDNDIFSQPQSLIEQANISDDEELFKSLPVQLPTAKTDCTKHEESDEELFKSLPIFQNSIPAKSLPKSGSNADIFKTPSEIRKVGKLKLGLNINVNALLPGASPKKVKPVDNTDGQAQSNVETIKEETKVVSFDKKPESEILDNKLSKERPRIQVKRRPSTRKARREAVRKSGIDFGEDSTDNSSSIDDPPKVTVEITKSNEITNTKEIKNEVINQNNDPKPPDFNDIVDTPISTESKHVELNDSLVNTAVEPEIRPEIVNKQIEIKPENPPRKSDSTTKIVYILNDEDIFNTSVIENSDNIKNVTSTIENVKTANEISSKNNESQPKNEISSKNNESQPKNIQIGLNNAEIENIQNLMTNSDEVKNLDTPKVEAIQGINTLGKAYQATKGSKDLFADDNSDDELFKNKKPVAKSNIFDSDSDEELFGTKKEKVVKVEKQEVKGSLFGDDDDDDLFGVKAKKSVDPQPQPSRATSSVKEPAKPAQQVFEDPLSMFGDD